MVQYPSSLPRDWDAVTYSWDADVVRAVLFAIGVNAMGKSRNGSLVRKVTGPQWEFCYAYVRTNDKYRALDAGYPKMRGRHPHLRRINASRLLKSKRLAALIEEMRLDIRQVQKITLEQHLSVLCDIRDRCLGEGKFREALRAEELRGKASGFYVDRKFSVNVDLSPEEMRLRAQSLVEANPALQRLLGLDQAPDAQVLRLPGAPQPESSGQGTPEIVAEG